MRPLYLRLNESFCKNPRKFWAEKLILYLHSIGMSPNVRKNLPYTDLNYDFYMKSMDVSAMSLHKMMSVAFKMDTPLQSGGVFVALSYIAAQRTYPFYNDMAEAKAMLESIVRKFRLPLWKSQKSQN